MYRDFVGIYIMSVVTPLSRSLGNKNMAYTQGKRTYGPVPTIPFIKDSKCTVGAYCSLASGITIYLGGNHRPDFVTTYPLPHFFPTHELKDIEYHTSKGDVVIGNDVWIGANVTIMSGVTIGNGAVIGACAVVAKNIPAYAIAVGNPARVVKYRFTPIQIAALESIAWWDWDDAKVAKYTSLLCSTKIDELLAVAMPSPAPPSSAPPSPALEVTAPEQTTSAHSP